ncbi:MAG TPA: DUF4038 domain-containing protein [Fimbriimonas sp.]|nr:DUF4038 domain-containing protein [Fimbriimonas sp.]
MSTFLGGMLISLAAMFPITHSADKRYLVDRSGKPFPILGRTSWFVLSLSRQDYQRYVDDTVAKGFNSVEMHVLNHDPRGSHPPFDGEGNAPFARRLDGSNWNGSLDYKKVGEEAPDFTKPSEPYWYFVDQFLDCCQTKGVLVFLFPAYVGFAGQEQGWMKELVANGPDRAFSYGQWIARRLAKRPNIVWMLGGDMGQFTPEQLKVEVALAEGLKSVPNQQSKQFCAEWNSESIAKDQSDLGKYMTLNGAYSWEGFVNRQARRAYAYQPAIPSFLLEEPYDEEGPDGNSVNPHATQPVRRFQWMGVLGAIGGYISGNGYIWPFRKDEWQKHLNTPGAEDMAHLNAFWKAVNWWDLVPSGLNGMRVLVEDNAPEADKAYVSAAATPDGRLLVAYIPPAHLGPVKLDLTVMQGKPHAEWFNPTTGKRTSIGELEGGRSLKLSPPGENGSGFSDWVLVVRSK